MQTIFTSLLFLLTVIAVSAQTSEQYLVSSQTLNMRSGQGKEYEIVITLSQGDGVSVLEKNQNGWWLVDYNGTQGYVFSELLKKDPYSGWDKKDYQSGVTPECENVDPQYDYKIDNYLKVNAGSNTDVVIKLMKQSYYDDICIRIIYIRSGETYYLKNIPEAKYYLKIAYGKDWRQKIVDGQCYTKFMKNAQYEKGTEILDYNVEKLYDRERVPSFELSLDVITTKHDENTFNSNDISESEFNK